MGSHLDEKQVDSLVPRLGDWVEGDRQLCGWVAAPQIPHHRIAEAHTAD